MLKEFILLILFICLIPFICLGVLTFLLIKLVFLLAKNILQFFKIPKTFWSKKSYPTKIMLIVNFGLSNILTTLTIAYIKKRQFIHFTKDIVSNNNNNFIDSISNYDIPAYIGIFTLLFILPFYLLYILEKNITFTVCQTIKITIITSFSLILLRYSYNISTKYLILMLFVNFWCAISLLYNLAVLARKKIYDWLFDVPQSKPCKPKTNRKLNVAKLTLLWTIIVFILGIIFNIKK